MAYTKAIPLERFFTLVLSLDPWIKLAPPHQWAHGLVLPVWSAYGRAGRVFRAGGER